MSTEASTRRHSRHYVPAQCIVRSRQSGELVGDRVLDMSYSGLRLNHLGGARLGERLDVSIRIPGSSFWLHAVGEVARVSDGLRDEDDRPSLGVWLRKMHGMDRIVMATYARRRPVVPPSRGGGRRDYAKAVLRIANSSGRLRRRSAAGPPSAPLRSASAGPASTSSG